jgi:decaprenylphospho-beta-D-ribofuranose 2-oxidase
MAESALLTSERRVQLAGTAPTRLSGWGRRPTAEGYEVLSEDLERATRHVSLTRGLGRSYGDASLPAPSAPLTAGSRLADRVLSFDERTGVLRAEAGLSLFRLNRLLLGRGWFTPVTPGTQYVTLGGMVAADVHGKNHHKAGTFGEHVLGLRMRVADGRVIEVSEREEPELFRATLGGMGLTGHVLEVEVRLKRVPSPWIWGESERVPNLDTLVERLVDAGRDWHYTVAWADCLSRGKSLGRGILFKGRWAEPGEVATEAPVWGSAFEIPVDFPNWALMTPGVRTLNALKYLAHGRRERVGPVHPEKFFYPLDVLQSWNRVYGPRGFTQYQPVIPVTAYRKFFDIVDKYHGHCYLCVIKDFGAEGRGMISFPKPGLSFNLDFPFEGPKTQALVDALNDLVAAEGGRVYLAKDAFTREEHFRAMEPRLGAFGAVRRAWDPDGRLRSQLSVRLFGDRA